jgi:hypothetical protein
MLRLCSCTGQRCTRQPKATPQAAHHLCTGTAGQRGFRVLAWLQEELGQAQSLAA